MQFDFESLSTELGKAFGIKNYNMRPGILLEEVAMFPVKLDLTDVTLNQTTAYICDYFTLKKVNPKSAMAPLICVIDPSTRADEAYLRDRTLILVTSESIFPVMLFLNKTFYNFGCMDSPLIEMSRKLFQCASLTELMKNGYDVLNNPMVILNNMQKIITYTDPMFVHNPFFKELVDHEYIPIGHPVCTGDSPVWTSHRDELNYSCPPELLPAVYCKTLKINDRIIGYLQVLQINRTLTEQDKNYTELLSGLIAAEINKHPERRPIDGSQKKEQFLRDILNDSFLVQGSKEKAQAALGLQFAPCLYTAYVQQKEAPDGCSVYTVVKELRPLLKECTSFVYDNGIFILCEAAQEITVLTDLFKPAQELVDKYDLVIGVSNMFSDMERLQDSYHKTRTAICLGQKLYPQRSLHVFSEYAIYYMIELASKHSDLEIFLLPGLKRLVDCCQGSGPELLETLRVYLECSLSKPKTAQKLFIHVNTVKYRVSQIEEIMGISLSEDENALKCMLSLKVLDYAAKFMDNNILNQGNN